MRLISGLAVTAAITKLQSRAATLPVAWIGEMWNTPPAESPD
jgi:hypothetical protein